VDKRHRHRLPHGLPGRLAKGALAQASAWLQAFAGRTKTLSRQAMDQP